MRFYIGNEYSPLCVVTKTPIKKNSIEVPNSNDFRNPINKEKNGKFKIVERSHR
jgi:hypothetical protein